MLMDKKALQKKFRIAHVLSKAQTSTVQDFLSFVFLIHLGRRTSLVAFGRKFTNLTKYNASRSYEKFPSQNEFCKTTIITSYTDKRDRET